MTWPPTLEYVEDLEKKATELDRLREREILRPFVGEFRDSLASLLAATPWEQWPEFVKKVFTFVADNRGFGNEARLYRSLLPKAGYTNES